MVCGHWTQQTWGEGYEGISPSERKSELEPRDTANVSHPCSQLRVGFKHHALLPSSPALVLLCGRAASSLWASVFS